MWRAKRAFPFPVQPVDSGTSDYSIQPGMLEAGLTISVPYSANVTAVGLAVRAYSLPVRRVLLKDKFGNTLHVWRARDLIAFAQIFEQASLASMLTPVAGFGVANTANLMAHIHLPFEQIGPKIGVDADQTTLPTFAYGKDGLTLTVEWGGVTDLLTGTPTGTVTFNPATAASGAPIVEQIDYADVKITSGRSLASIIPVAVNRYKEIATVAVAADATELQIENDANIRGILLCQETANGEPTETIVDTVTLTEDNILSPYNKRPWATIKSENAKHFGVTMPTGYVVLDFAEDGVIDRNKIYRAVNKNKISLFFKQEAVVGTIRATLLTIKPPRQF